MRVTKRVLQASGLIAGVIGVVAASAPETGAGRAARRLAQRLARDARYAVASAPGLLYRLSGRHPDPGVSDDVLADRIRSSLGPLEKRLDIPRVHVMVEDHVAIVHGEVPADSDARAIGHAIIRVSGVRGVESHLHPGLIAGDTRPSEGAREGRHPSEAMRLLLSAAQDAGAGPEPRDTVHTVLCGFTDRIPEGERVHVLAHLPSDARALAGPAHRHGEHAPRVKSLPQLVASAVEQGGLDPRHAERITRSVVAALRSLVPEEADDVAAVLPAELRDLWDPEPAR